MGFDRHGADGPSQASGAAWPQPAASALPSSSPSPSPSLPTPLIDPQAIERLRELDPSGQLGVLRRVLQAYEASLKRHLADIEQAATTGDADRLSRAAHTLKSSSAAIGAMDFSQRCAELEQQLRSQRQVPPVAELQSLVADGRQVLAAVEAMLAT
ncbi:MAG: Hpt domain-containing protein [Proteobacteria bacterium]|nr:Hpt domain-containing protein [Pseudomonadota bacterium]